MPCTAVFNGEVCGHHKTHGFHVHYGHDHPPALICHPYQEKESNMIKKWIFEDKDGDAYNSITITRPPDVRYLKMQIGGMLNPEARISAKALREMADILDGNEPEVIRKTITL